MRFGPFVSFKVIHKGKKKDKKSDSNTENTLPVARGEGDGELGETGGGDEGYTWEEHRVMEGSAESLPCTPETNIALCTNYTSTVKKWEKIKAQERKICCKKNYQATCLITRGKSFIIAFGSKDFRPQLDQPRSVFSSVLTSPFYFLSQYKRITPPLG